MAPSPTGEYHIGHIRTVLYNWAYARQQKGKFIIRIEDTDRTRFVEGATDRILQVIKDYGFNWDEGPIFQSERLPIYKEHAEQLIEKGAAYYCFCTSERLEKMRAEQQAKGMPTTKYDRHCLHLSESEIQEKLQAKTPYVIRLKVPDNRKIAFDDLVFGHIEISSNDLDDQVLLKSDGFPTYQLAVVIDDHLMNVTHIMRGNDWLPSTPKHVLLYEAFGWDMPTHIHLPNLKELGGNKKLSKRFGAVFAQEFLDEGYLPEALLNFLMFLGWNPGGEQEMYTLDEFVKVFDINKIHKTDLVAFDRKKLEWFNLQYIKLKSNEELTQLLVKYAPKGVDVALLGKITPLVKERMKKLTDFMSLAQFFFSEPEIDTSLFSQNVRKHLSEASDSLNQSPEWDVDAIGSALTGAVGTNAFKASDFFMDLRIAVSGQKITPPLNDSMVILGKDVVMKRLLHAIEKLGVE